MGDKILEEILRYIEASKDFVLAEAPEVIQQMCAWEFWGSIATCIILSILLCVSLAGSIFALKKQLKQKSSFEIGWGLSSAGGFAVSLVLFLVISANAMDAIKVKIAPKYYIVQKICELAKSK